EVFQIVARIYLSPFKSVRPFDGSELLAGINDALQFLVGVWSLVGNTIRAYWRLHVDTDRVFHQPFPIHAEPKESAQRAETFALGARAEIPARIENVNISRCELIEHHIAALVRKIRELLRERSILTQGSRCDLRALPVTQEDFDRVGNDDA